MTITILRAFSIPKHLSGNKSHGGVETSQHKIKASVYHIQMCLSSNLIIPFNMKVLFKGGKRRKNKSIECQRTTVVKFHMLFSHVPH